MALEIEHKFLLRDQSWRDAVRASHHIRQGYLVADGPVTVRIRLIDDQRALITIKLPHSRITRHEFEYDVPLQDGRSMLALAGDRVIEKTRHEIDIDGALFTVDVFTGRHEGLVLAEIELDSEDAGFPHPDWLGTEVTEDPRYYNSSLADASKPPVI